jgi:hypothetical protein
MTVRPIRDCVPDPPPERTCRAVISSIAALQAVKEREEGCKSRKKGKWGKRGKAGLKADRAILRPFVFSPIPLQDGAAPRKEDAPRINVRGESTDRIHLAGREIFTVQTR